MENNFPKTWELLPLEDCMEAIIDYRGKTPHKSSFGIPLITAKIVKGGRILEPTEFIPYEDYDERMQRGIPNAGDIVVTTEAPLGEVGQLDNRKLSVGQRLITLRGKSGFLDNTYLKFLMMSDFVQNQLLARATGTTVIGIKQTELRKIDLVIPPLSEQRAIAGILGMLDDKIEVNRRMNATLESMVRAVFRQWFVGSEEVGDWKKGTVGDIIKRIPVGKKYDFKTVEPKGNVPVLDQSHFTIIGYHNEEPGVIATIDNPVIVFSNHRCYTDIIHFPFSAIQNVLPFVGDGVDTRWLYHATDGIIEYSEYKGHYPEFISKPLVIPPEELTNKFGEFVKPIHIKIMKNKEESRTLGSLRDSLLPKLMRGEVRVSAL